MIVRNLQEHSLDLPFSCEILSHDITSIIIDEMEHVVELHRLLLFS